MARSNNISLYLVSIIMLFILPIIPIVILCIIDSLSSRFKYQNLAQIVTTTLILLGIFLSIIEFRWITKLCN